LRSAYVWADSVGGTFRSDHLELAAALVHVVEGIAAAQSALSPAAHAGWIAHLDRVLRGEFPRSLLDAWRGMQLNPLRHLEAPALAPRALSPEDRRHYLKVLREAAQRWGV
jgi:hypothetical protein